MRDYQRSRVYSLDERLEYAAKQVDVTTYEEGLDVAEVEKIVERCFELNLISGHKLEVRDGRGRRKSGGCADYITITRSHRNTVIVAHEIAHAVIWRFHGARGVPPHGAQYMAAYRAILLGLGVLDAETFDRLAKAERVDVAASIIDMSIGV